MKSSIILCIFFFILIAGCNLNNSVSTSNTDYLNKLTVPASSDSLVLNDTTAIAFNDTIGSSTENIWISFDSLGSDSRCPVNVVCIWEGNAEVFFSITTEAVNTPFVLNTNPTFMREILLHGYTIELIDLLPYPHTDSLFTDTDHVAKLIVSK